MHVSTKWKLQHRKLLKQWIRRHLVVGPETINDFGMATRRVTMDGCYVTTVFPGGAQSNLEDDPWVRFLYINGITRAYAPRDFHPDFRSDVAWVGFNETSREYFGWSHRGWAKFWIGHVTKEGDCQCYSGYVPGYLEEHPELDFRIKPGFVCRTLEDCKRVAFAYAESIG